jgi:hypothetical protein
MREVGFFYLKASGNQSGTSHNCQHHGKCSAKVCSVNSGYLKPCNVRAYNTVTYGEFLHAIRFLEHLQWCSVCEPAQMKSQNMPVSLRKLVLAQHNWTVCGGWLMAQQWCTHTCTEQFNKYDLDFALFSLPYHNDWSRWFAISSPPPTYCASFSFMGGVAKEYITELGCEKYFRRVTYQALLEMLLSLSRVTYVTLGSLVLRRFCKSVTTDFLRTQLFSKCGVGLGYHRNLIPLFPERSQPLPP